MKVQVLAASAAIAVAVSVTGGAISQAQAPKPAAVYMADGKLEFPKDYRTWVFLSSGVDMSYSEQAQAAVGRGHAFDNVFVDRVAYDAFMKTGEWPQGSVFVLEIRRGEGQGSINKAGQFQTQRLALEVHVKDKKFKSGWAFFGGFQNEGPGREIPQTSTCNTCHEQHAAVDTTFVQFYPTLLPRAKELGKLSAAYLAADRAVVK